VLDLSVEIQNLQRQLRFGHFNQNNVAYCNSKRCF